MGERRGQSKSKVSKKNNGAILGFEEKLRQAADKLRGHMDAAEYKHVVLGLIFLKYISDAFEERRAALLQEKYADPEDRDEYVAAQFWPNSISNILPGETCGIDYTITEDRSAKSIEAKVVRVNIWQ